MKKKFKQDTLFFIIVFCTSAFFLFIGLDHPFLWQDEACSALLSRNIFKFGIPTAFDGTHLLADQSTDINSKLLWRIWGWFPLYLGSISNLFLTSSTTGARLPFALLTLLFYLFFLKSTLMGKKQKWIFFILLITNTPLLILFRQAGYYAPSIIFSFLIFLLANRFNSKKDKTLFHMFNLLLLHSNILIWACSTTGVFLILFLKSVRNKSYLFIKHGFICFLLNLVPIILLYRPWEVTSKYTNALSLQSSTFFLLLKTLFWPITPIPILLLLLTSFLLMKNKIKDEIKPINSSIIFIIGYLATYNYLGPDSTYFRYLAPLAPIIIFLKSQIIVQLFTRGKCIVASAFITIFLLFNIFGLFCNKLSDLPKEHNQKFYLLNLVQSLMSKVPDTNKELISFLIKNSKKNETLFANYGTYPIIYYTKLKVGGGKPGYYLPGEHQEKELNLHFKSINLPDWVIIRKDWPFHRKKLLNLVKTNAYKKIEKPFIIDSEWGARPSPYYYPFKKKQKTKELAIYRKINLIQPKNQ